MIRNRDTQCTVYVYALPWYNYTAGWYAFGNNSQYYDIPDFLDPAYGGDDGISSHQRCSL